MLGLFDGSLILGVGGLMGMAGLQLGHHVGAHSGDAGGGVHLGDAGHGMHVGDAGHGVHIGDAGHAHLGDTGHIGHVGDTGHVGDAGHAGHVGDTGHGGQVIQHGHHAHVGHAHSHGVDQGHGGQGEEVAVHKAPLWLIPSPITVFSWLIGFGLAGIIFREWVPIYSWLIALSVICAVLFERGMVRPYWDFLFRFASAPGTNLQGTVATKAMAVTSFNRSGRGLVRVCVDGQDRDVLARLMPGQAPVPVRKGDTLFVERADEDNTLLVSRPDLPQ